MFSRKVIIRALVCALLAMIPLPEQENQVYDWKVRSLSHTYREKPQSVLVLEFSREDFEALRKRLDPHPASFQDSLWREKFDSIRNEFFWNDRVYEALLTRVLEEKPQRLLVTFFYGESFIHLKDNPKLQRLARDPAVLWASQFDVEQKHTKPASQLTGTENYGFSNLTTGTDGVVRDAYLVKRNHISLPFRALVDGPDSLRTDIPLTEPFLINFRGQPGHIPNCRVLDLFSSPPGKGPCGSLKNRYVILANTGSVLTGASLYRTPVGNMSRGEALANILVTTKGDFPLVPVSKFLLFFVLIVHCFLISRLVLNLTTSYQILGISTLLGLETAFSLLALRFLDREIPLVPFLLATVFGYVSFLWLKSAQQESKRWQAEKKNQYLRELDELKSNFTSLMSHDLKTPIAKVQALTERLSREAMGLSSDQKEILSAIRKSNEELSEYIHSILSFQKIESQEIKLHKKSHDINLLIEEVVNRLQPVWQEKGVAVLQDLEPMFAVEFDEQLIKQVLTNLIDNAIKYNPAGTQITVHSKDLGDYIEVCVADTGIGMDEEQQSRLFKKFSRAEKGTSERVKGSGLGLYLAKYFIELHGGSIWVESKPAQGTKFHFKLPVHS